MASRDLVQFFVCILTVGLTWLMLGLENGAAIMRHDGMNSLLPIVTMLTDTGDWKALAYRPELFGGTNLLGTYGLLPITIGLAELGLSPVTNLNASLMFIQALLGFLAGRAIISLSGRSTTWVSDTVISIAMIWLVAFAPMIGWRINVGHLDQLAGLLFVQAALTLWICLAKERLSLVTLVVIVAALVHGLCVPGFQVIVYASVFALPLLIGFVLEERCMPNRSGIASASIVAFSTALIAAPILVPMAVYAFGPDASRTPGAGIVTWSYITSTGVDWLSSISWFEHGISGRPLPLLHEVNYGIGPALCLAVFFVQKKKWRILAGLAMSLVMCLVFSMNIQPVSTWIAHLPLMGDFRIPARSIMPVMIAWQTIALGLVVAQWPALSSQHWIAASFALVIVATSLKAFERRIEFEHGADQVLLENRAFGARAIELEPALASPFTRASIDIGQMGLLTSSAGRIHTINGYGFPARHFSESIQRLSGEDPNATRTAFSLLPGANGFDVAQQRYNICCSITAVEGQPRVTRLPPTRGEAWSECGLEFERVRFDPRAYDITILRPAGTACPVTISTTFAENLQVAAVTDAGTLLLTPQVTEESLLGVTIPPGTDEIRIRTTVPYYPWTVFLMCLGLVVLGLQFTAASAARPPAH